MAFQDSIRTASNGTRIPGSTYRLQFNSHFTFRDAREIVDYLHRLGVTDCYASPIFAARPGSLHGYDVVDPSILNPELGSEEDFRQFVSALRERRMGLILDVVPNHMCIAGEGNQWWNDLLENGPGSPYASFFEIDWEPPKQNLHHKILLPILEDQFGRVLEDQKLRLIYQSGGFFLRYYETRFPISPRSSILIFEELLKSLSGELPESHEERAELESILFALEHLPPRDELAAEKVKQRRREKESVKRRLSALVRSSPAIRGTLHRTVMRLNGVQGDPSSFDLLEKLLDKQPYRLSFWRVAADEINYRRFFDVNELATIRVEKPKVFAAVHQLVFRLIREGAVTGLRIDHIDGLRDPERYLEQLRRGCRKVLKIPGGRNGSRLCYVVIEKILEPGERLNPRWATHGTTGYDFLNLLNGVFVDKNNEQAFRQIWRRISESTQTFDVAEYEGKRLILRVAMSGELHVLARRLERIADQHRYSRDFTFNRLHEALAEVIASFPKYRTYIRQGKIGSRPKITLEDRRAIRTAVHRARMRNPAMSKTLFDFIASVLLVDESRDLSQEQRHERRDFVMRFQQLTGPVTAKGVEDTAFYRYFPLVSLCEVGGSPQQFGVSVEDFHRANAERLRESPHTLLATSTHDTKRGEDVRARLNVLSEMPDLWDETLHRWQELNQHLKRMVNEALVPDPVEEYLIYQTLIGTFPLEFEDESARETYTRRIQDYLIKALREAKIHSSWLNPMDEYEAVVRQFIEKLLATKGAFLEDFVSFQQRTTRAGVLNSLSQVLLKITSPGVPDFYQGAESWDFNLVDPDNRRPVDYARLTGLLSSSNDAIATLLSNPGDGAIKMLVTSQLLGFRNQNRELLERGEYIPLVVNGSLANHVIGFARSLQDQMAVIIATRFMSGFSDGREIDWGETSIELKSDAAGCYRELLSSNRVCVSQSEPRILLSEVFRDMPIALLTRE